MSKLYDRYKILKQENGEIYYLFKAGMFYLLLDEDAKNASKILGLKCTPLNGTIVKCGFPLNALEKYLNLFSEQNLKFKIIDREVIENHQNYLQDVKINQLLEKIKKADINKMNGIQALLYISQLKDLL